MPKVPWFVGIIGLAFLLAFLSLVVKPWAMCGDRGSQTRAQIICPMFF